LCDLLGDDDAAVRSGALTVIGHICSHPAGKEALAKEKGILSQLILKFDDENPEVQRAAYVTVFNQSSSRAGAQSLIDIGALPILLRSASELVELDLLEMAVDIVLHCVQLDSGLVEALQYPFPQSN
jgi:hypothetical protein